MDKSTSVPRCSGCGRFVGKDTHVVLSKRPDEKYCYECYRRGVKEEEMAMGLYDYSNECMDHVYSPTTIDTSDDPLPF